MLEQEERLALRKARAHFMIGEINQGIQSVLPTKNTVTGQWDKANFTDLVDEFFYNIDYPPGYEKAEPFHYDDMEGLKRLYLDAIEQWLDRYNLDL